MKPGYVSAFSNHRGVKASQAKPITTSPGTLVVSCTVSCRIKHQSGNENSEEDRRVSGERESHKTWNQKEREAGWPGR